MKLTATSKVYNNSICVKEENCCAAILVQTPVGCATIEVVSGGATGQPGSIGGELTFPLIQKAEGNTGGANVIEIGDIVYFKPLPPLPPSSTPVILTNFRYIGGGIDLRSSYENVGVMEF